VSKRVRRDTGREYRSGYHSAVRRQKVRAGSGVVERWRQPGVAVSASSCLLLPPPSPMMLAAQHSPDAALFTNLLLLCHNGMVRYAAGFVCNAVVLRLRSAASGLGRRTQGSAASGWMSAAAR
jgi:hypothetical protein